MSIWRLLVLLSVMLQYVIMKLLYNIYSLVSICLSRRIFLSRLSLFFSLFFFFLDFSTQNIEWWEGGRICNDGGCLSHSLFLRKRKYEIAIPGVARKVSPFLLHWKTRLNERHHLLLPRHTPLSMKLNRTYTNKRTRLKLTTAHIQTGNLVKAMNSDRHQRNTEEE